MPAENMQIISNFKRWPNKPHINGTFAIYNTEMSKVSKSIFYSIAITFSQCIYRLFGSLIANPSWVHSFLFLIISNISFYHRHTNFLYTIIDLCLFLTVKLELTCDISEAWTATYSLHVCNILKTDWQVHPRIKNQTANVPAFRRSW